jgi:hypothetical protein
VDNSEITRTLMSQADLEVGRPLTPERFKEAIDIAARGEEILWAQAMGKRPQRPGEETLVLDRTVVLVTATRLVDVTADGFSVMCNVRLWSRLVATRVSYNSFGVGGELYPSLVELEFASRLGSSDEVSADAGELTLSRAFLHPSRGVGSLPDMFFGLASAPSN